MSKRGNSVSCPLMTHVLGVSWKRSCMRPSSSNFRLSMCCSISRMTPDDFVRVCISIFLDTCMNSVIAPTLALPSNNFRLIVLLYLLASRSGCRASYMVEFTKSTYCFIICVVRTMSGNTLQRILVDDDVEFVRECFVKCINYMKSAYGSQLLDFTTMMDFVSMRDSMHNVRKIVILFVLANEVPFQTAIVNISLCPSKDKTFIRTLRYLVEAFQNVQYRSFDTVSASDLFLIDCKDHYIVS